MFGTWYDLQIRAPEGSGYTTPEALKPVDALVNVDVDNV